MRWYNHEHKHSSLKFLTPAQRHRGDDIQILADRKAVYERAKAQNPSRWSGDTRNWAHQQAMTLNSMKEASTKFRIYRATMLTNAAPWETLRTFIMSLML
jgi:hypothetical protein